jgi:hypothetical protein
VQGPVVAVQCRPGRGGPIAAFSGLLLPSRHSKFIRKVDAAVLAGSATHSIVALATT